MSMARAGDFRETATTPGRGILRMVENRTDRGKFWTGEYVHRAGIVTILQEPPTGAWPEGLTRLDAVVGGKLIYRTWDRFWASTSLPKLARQLLGVE